MRGGPVQQLRVAVVEVDANRPGDRPGQIRDQGHRVAGGLGDDLPDADLTQAAERAAVPGDDAAPLDDA